MPDTSAIYELYFMERGLKDIKYLRDSLVYSENCPSEDLCETVDTDHYDYEHIINETQNINRNIIEGSNI